MLGARRCDKQFLDNLFAQETDNDLLYWSYLYSLFNTMYINIQLQL